MKIALIGASSTGKSTLAERLAQELNLPLIREQARVVLAELGKSLHELRAVQSEILAFQNRVLEYQIASELECADTGFVSDRSVFDNLTLYLRHCPVNPEDVEYYKATVFKHYKKYPYDFLIFLRPGEFPAVADGTRTADPLYQAQIDGMIFAILRLFSVPYFEIHGGIEQRIREIRALIASYQNIDPRSINKEF